MVEKNDKNSRYKFYEIDDEKVWKKFSIFFLDLEW